MDILTKQPSVRGPAEWFTGVVYFDVIAPADQARLKVNSVHFTPGARTAWHRHLNGQILHVTEGIGLTQSRGGEVTVICPGDTVWCPPREWHWHGAAPDHFITQLEMWDGLAEGQGGIETEWGDHVTDAEYNQR